MAVYLICYALSYLLARQHVYMLSGLVLITAALWLYWRDYRASRDLIHLRGLFCLAFVGGQGVSCFKLSRLQTDWAGETWLCFLLAVLAFWLAFEAVQRMASRKRECGSREHGSRNSNPFSGSGGHRSVLRQLEADSRLHGRHHGRLGPGLCF